MASTSKLHNSLSPLSTKLKWKKIRNVHVVLFDINLTNHSIFNTQFQTKIFKEKEVDAWFNYLTKSEIKNVYLFLSNIVNNIFLQLLCESPQIEGVYIFRKEKQFPDYSYNGSKFRGIFNDYNSMFKQFADDLMKLKSEDNLEQDTFDIVDGQNDKILWWKFFEKVLQHIRSTNTAKQEFIDFFRETFQNDSDALRGIDEFERNYTSNKAIYWYTQTCGIYRLVNQMLRTEKNFNNIFKIRFFLTDLVSGLKTEHSKYITRTHSLMIYRGQSIKLEEVERMKAALGKTIYVKQFFSTTVNRNIAEGFVHFDDHLFPEHVLFIIEIEALDINNSMSFVANIAKHSFYPREEEILFSMYSTFQVVYTRQVTEHFHEVHLKFIDNPWNKDFHQTRLFNPHIDQIFMQNLSKDNQQSIGFQLLFDMILRLEQTEYAKQELLQYSRSKYQHDSTILKQIDDFGRNYQSENAAKWYREESFLYQLLERCMSIEPINCIIQMRYFIHDLHSQIAKFHPSFIQSLNGKTDLTLYRSRIMKINQLEEMRQNYGAIISMQKFFSATQDKQLADRLSSEGFRLNPDERSVRYEITIDTNIQSVPYAHIKDRQEEILFSMGTVFRIGNVYESSNRIFVIELIMAQIQNQLWTKLTAHLDL